MDRVGDIKAPRGSKTEMILAALEGLPREFTVVQLEKACPGVSREMVRRVLGSQKGKRVKCIGRARRSMDQDRLRQERVMSVKEGNKEGSDLSQFAFLRQEWPAAYEAAGKAESLVYPDSRSSCFYARRALELAVHWLYKHDSTSKTSLSRPLERARSRTDVSVRRRPGDLRQDESDQRPWQSGRPQPQACATVQCYYRDKDLFHVMFWLARTYASGTKPADGLSFNADLLPQSGWAPPQTMEQLQNLENQLHERDEKLAELLSVRKGMTLERLRIEVAEAKKQNAARPDDHNYSEAETRDYFIDLLLKEAGWGLASAQDREFPVRGMPSNTGEGFVDYVLWGDDGKRLGLVEAKRTKRDSRSDNSRRNFMRIVWRSNSASGR